MDHSLSLHPATLQSQRVRRVLFAIVMGGSAHTLLCWIALQLDFFRGGDALFISLFSIIWAGHALFVTFMVLGLNRRLAEPAMILPLMVWSTTGLLVTAAVVDQARLCVMLIFFAIVQLGVLQASLRQFIFLAVYCVLGYAIVLGIVWIYWPEVVDVQGEWIQWALFSVMVLGVTLLAAEISNIRTLLGRRNAQLADVVERIHDMAVKDELTGFYRRRHAMELLGKACSQSARGAFSLAVAYADLDFFKRINDQYGHGMGDMVLQRFAEVVSRHLSGQDFAARLGGEEFMLVLPVSDEQEARHLVEGILMGMRSQRFAEAPDLTVTLSAGLAMLAPGENPAQVIRRADAALYRAKETGRDKLVLEARS
ncbi:GGDEF domain-containing protein [Alcanivorax sp. S6407]|uniref:GGDEF domain-containing protein n=1 Tax=Alcanivorax sp. S6407 TaxID=2926424 RepID=UPI001FF0F24C|nr:GGDEF domain-containing protein [Alcanivorax sp. S6407]MCK0155177.1 GGDEF domain-containing protein [Alcanivorax sp. S6407]